MPYTALSSKFKLLGHANKIVSAALSSSGIAGIEHGNIRKRPRYLRVQVPRSGDLQKGRFEHRDVVLTARFY